MQYATLDLGDKGVCTRILLGWINECFFDLNINEVFSL